SAKRLALKAVCAAPIRFRRETLGVLVLDQKSHGARGFDAAAETFATEFARGAGGVVFRARRQDAQRLAQQALLDEYAREAERVRGRFRAEGIAGSSPAIGSLLRLLERVSARDVRVLIRGESGT